MKMCRNPNEQDGDVLPMGSTVDMLTTMRPDEMDEEKETPMYEKYDALLHGASRRRTDKILSVDFMRKYIHFVKILKPVLTEEACEIIANEYSKLRSEDILESDVARVNSVVLFGVGVDWLEFLDATSHSAYFGNHDSISNRAC